MECTEIKEGHFKGWFKTPAGDIFKGFGKKNSNPTIWYLKGYFEVCDARGHRNKISYNTLAEALHSVGIKYISKGKQHGS